MPWLSVLSNIAPVGICRKAAAYDKSRPPLHSNSPVDADIIDHPPARLKSRHSVWLDSVPIKGSHHDMERKLVVGSCGQLLPCGWSHNLAARFRLPAFSVDSIQGKGHVMLTCTSWTSPSQVTVIAVQCRQWTTLWTRALWQKYGGVLSTLYDAGDDALLWLTRTVTTKAFTK